MRGHGGGEVVRVEQRLRYEAQDVLVLGGVEDVVSRAARPHESCEPQLGQMLGYRRGRHADVGGEIPHRVFTMQQGPHDVQTGAVGQQLQRRGCCIQLLSGNRLYTYLRSHAYSVAPPAFQRPQPYAA